MEERHTHGSRHAIDIIYPNFPQAPNTSYSPGVSGIDELLKIDEADLLRAHGMKRSDPLLNHRRENDHNIYTPLPRVIVNWLSAAVL